MTATEAPAAEAAITVEVDTTISGFILVDGDRLPLTGRELDGYWYVYAGVDGEYGGDSVTLADAARKLARALTVSGAVEIHFGDNDPYTLDLAGADAPAAGCASTQIPAERIRPGVATQIVNVHNPETGEFVRQVRYRGTEAQARAYGEIGFWHPTQKRWHELRAIVRGK